MYLLRNVPIETFNILFQSTFNKQQYGSQITCIEVRGGGGGESYGEFKNCYNNFPTFGDLMYSSPLLMTCAAYILYISLLIVVLLSELCTVSCQNI